MRRTDLLDTSEKAWRMLLRRHRELTPEERARKMFLLVQEGREYEYRTAPLRKSTKS